MSRYLCGETPISTSLTREASELLFKIRNNDKSLNDYAKITRGVHPYRIGGYGQTAFGNGCQSRQDVEERPYHSKKPKKGYRKFIYGRDLKRYRTPEAKEFVKYGPWLAEPRDPDFFSGDRVYSRKILGDRLIVTVEKINSIADQQVYITKPNDNKVDATFILLG